MGLFHWEEAFQAKTLYDPLLCSPIACACLNSCVVLGDVVVRLRQETKDYQGLQHAKCRWLRIALVTKGPEEPFRTRSFGVSCLTGQHLACLFTEWTPASPAKSIVSQTKPRSRQVLMQNHIEAWIWGFTMDLPCFTRVREICHVGNIWKRRHSGTLHWELRAEQLDSKIEEGSTPISVCWYLNIFNNVLYDFHDRCLVCATCTARAVCILVPEWSVQWYDLIQETNFGSPESYISKTIRPTWATSCLLLSSLRGCCVALSSVTIDHFRLFWFFLMPRVSCTLVFTFFWNQGWWLWTSEAQNPLAV